jgi:Outer membrane protein beta-barrel domain
MKKIILFAAFAVVAFATQAQVKFGAKAGLNLSTWTGDVENQKMKPGFYVGGLANIKVADQFSIQPELLFSAEGSKDADVNYNTMFVNIPVMAQYNTPSGFYVEAGPQLGFLVSAKAKADGESEDIKDFLNTTNFGASFGAGYNMGSGFGFGARYNLGLSNALKDAGEDKVKTSNISIGLHYNFGGAKSSKD